MAIDKNGRDSFEGQWGQKRNKAERERDRALVAEMHFRQGMINADIARVLNSRDGIRYQVSKRTIGYDVEAVVKEYTKEHAPAYWIEEEILRLDMVEREAWGAWDRSLQPKERTVTKEGSNNFGAYDEVQQLVEKRVGDKKFLDIILSCIEKRNRLRGIGGINMKIQQTTEHVIKAYAVVSPGDWDNESATLPENSSVRIVDQGRLEDGNSNSQD